MMYIEKVTDNVWAGYTTFPWEIRGKGPKASVFMVRIATGVDADDVRQGLVTGNNRGAFSLAALRRLKELLDNLFYGTEDACFVTEDTPVAARLITWRRVDDYYVRITGGMNGFLKPRQNGGISGAGQSV